MGNETIVFRSKEQKSRSDLTGFLRQLADKIDEGGVLLRRKQEEFTVDIPQSLVLGVKVEEKLKKVKRHSLEIEIEWFDSEQGGSLELG